MTEFEHDVNGLTEAKAQFLEAEKRLRELAQGAVELTRASVMLKKARMGLTDGAEALRDLSARLSEYIDALAEVTTQISAAKQGTPADETMRAQFEQIERRITELGETVTRSTAERSSPIDGSAALRDTDMAELKAIPGTVQARLAALDDVATRLAATVSDKDVQTIEAIASRFDSLEEKLAALATGPAEAPLADSVESSLGLVPDIAAGLERLRARIDAADFPGAAARLASLESGMTDLARQLKSTRDSSTGELDPGESLRGIESRLTEIAEGARIPVDLDAMAELLRALDVKIELLTTELEKTLRRVGGRMTNSGQLEISSDFEESLIALAQEVHAREVTNVDMLAELRRSVGREISRTHGEVLDAVARESKQLKAVVEKQARRLWIVALAAVGGLALALLQLF